jgi:hypothetical protein
MEVLAVDPDVEYNGIAKFDTESKAISVTKMTMPQLTEYMRSNNRNISKIIIEGGWLNDKVNFHGGNYRVAQKIAYAVGRNAQCGRIILQYADFYHIKSQTIKPLVKVWKNGKINHLELNRELTARGYTKFSRTNQDERDSILLLLHGI